MAGVPGERFRYRCADGIAARARRSTPSTKKRISVWLVGEASVRQRLTSMVGQAAPRVAFSVVTVSLSAAESSGSAVSRLSRMSVEMRP